MVDADGNTFLDVYAQIASIPVHPNDIGLILCRSAIITQLCWQLHNLQSSLVP